MDASEMMEDGKREGGPWGGDLFERETMARWLCVVEGKDSSRRHWTQDSVRGPSCNKKPGVLGDSMIPGAEACVCVPIFPVRLRRCFFMIKRKREGRTEQILMRKKIRYWNKNIFKKSEFSFFFYENDNAIFLLKKHSLKDKKKKHML